jgi:hypothetical protein
VPAAAEYASAVEHLTDASSRDPGRFLEPTAAVGPSPRPPISFATTEPGAEAADAEMSLRAVICERLSHITTLARVADPARLKPILLLALVVGLQSADGGTVGALVVSLKESLRINDIQVGLLVAVSTGVGAFTTLVAGALADRTVRVRLLWMALLVCSMAMALSAVAPNYGWLLACRVAARRHRNRRADNHARPVSYPGRRIRHRHPGVVDRIDHRVSGQPHSGRISGTVAGR